MELKRQQENEHRRQRCLVYGVARLRGKLTECLVEDVCKYKVNIGFKNFCTDDKENGHEKKIRR